MRNISFPKTSLKTRVTLYTLAMFLIGTWSLAFYASRTLYADMERLVGEQQLSTVSVLASGIDFELTERLKALEGVAQSLTPALIANAAALQKLLDERPVLSVFFNGGVIAYSDNGTAVAEVPVSAGRVGTNYMDIKTVALAIKEGRSNIGNPVMGKKLMSPVFGMSVPVRDQQGRVIGALAGVVNLGIPNFLDKVALNRYGKSGGYVIVDRDTRSVVTASDRKRVMEPLPAVGVSMQLDRFISGYDGSAIFTNRFGVEVLASVKGIQAANWYVGAILPTVEAFAPIHDLQQRMVLAALILTLLVGGLTWRMLRRQLTPLWAAMQGISELARSDQPTHALPVTRDDEVGRLIGGFNGLLQTLATREAALRQGHDALQGILATTLDGYWLVDLQGRLLDVNARYGQQSGYSRDELLTMTVQNLEANEDAAQTAVHIQKVITERRDQFESRHRRKDGTLWYVEVSATYQDIGDGQILVFLRDIDERVRARQVQEQVAALNVERNYLASIVESSNNSITSVTLDGIYTSWNRGAEKMFGYRYDEVLGRSIFDLVRPDQVGIERDRLARVGRGESILDEAGVRVHKSGSLVYVSVSISPIRDSDGTIIGAARVGHDTTASKLAAAALEDSNQRFRDLVDSTDGVVWEADASTFVFNYVSLNAERMLGYPVAQWLLPGFWADHIYPADRERAVQYCVACTGRLENHDFEYRFVAQDGRVLWLRDIVRVVEQDGKPRWLRGLMIDISTQKLSQQQLLASQDALYNTVMHKQAILDGMADAVITINVHGVMDSFNQAACLIFGYLPEEAIGQNVSLLMPEPHRSHHDGYLRHYQTTGEARVVGTLREVQGQRKDGSLFPISLAVTKLEHDGKISFVGLVRDITRQRQDEEEIRRLAYFDSLTGLANRRLLMDRLKQAMLASTRTARHGALMFLDLDHFKLLNDSRGHVIGDALLTQVAQRLTACVREGDSVARLGGDEFVVLLTGLSATDQEAVTDVESVSHKILDALGQPYQLQDMPHTSTPSIGIVLFMGESETLDDLLKKADVAMYQAKAAGRNTARFFDSQMQAMALERGQLEQDLRAGLAAQDFLLHYQIQVDGKGATTGVEALVRWKHAVRGMVSPGDFIPLAEETGLILVLGQWVLETACAQLVEWAKTERTARWTMAVNVSASQFAQGDFVANVEAALQKTGANPWLLKLELTESMLADDLDDIITKMSALKTRGVSFSLDDFGTGYSSLSYLKRLPLAQLKIDQSFVRDLLTDPGDAVIASTIVALGQSLGYKVIAEGVETLAQRDFLASIGCDAYQGYYFGRPMCSDAL